MSIAQAHEVLVDNIMELANREVDGTHSSMFLSRCVRYLEANGTSLAHNTLL